MAGVSFNGNENEQAEKKKMDFAFDVVNEGGK